MVGIGISKYRGIVGIVGMTSENTWSSRYGKGIEISQYRGIVGIVGVTSDNTWSSRYGKVLKYQNTGLSLVSWVWHLKILDQSRYGTSWASQDQIEIGERAGGGQFEELGTEKMTQHFYDQSGGDYWS